MASLRRTTATHLAGWLVLLAVLGGALAVTAFALTGSNGPVPPKRSLAAALRHAMTAPPVRGVTADIALSDNLLPGGSSTFKVGPLAGGSARLWAAGGRVRIDLRSPAVNADVAIAGGRLSVLDLRSHTEYVVPLPGHHRRDARHHRMHRVPSLAEIRAVLAQIAHRVVLSGAIPGDVAGRAAYTVRVSPRRHPGLLGALALTWDAARGVPLRFAIYPRGSTTAALALTVTHIRFGPVAAAQLRLPHPAGTRVELVHAPARPVSGGAHAHTKAVLGPAAVARLVGFRLAAPARLEGMTRRSVRLVGSGADAGALLVYGRGVGSVFVLERPSSGHAGNFRALPAVSLGRVSGRELETTLGTLVTFTRGGVTTTVFGSEPAGAIVAAARLLQ